MINSKYQPTISKNSSKIALFSFISGVTFLITGLLILIFTINSQKDIFPNETYINDLNVSLLSKDQAKEELQNSYTEDKQFKISIINNEIEIASSSTEISFSFLIDETLDQAFTETHQKLTLKKPFGLFSTLFDKKSFIIKKQFNTEKVLQLVNIFSLQVDQTGHDPKATLEITGNLDTLEIDPGKVGLEINKEKLLEKITNILEEKTDQEDILLSADPDSTYRELDEEEIIKAEARVSQFINQKIVLNSNQYKDLKLSINDQKLIDLLTLPEGTNEENINQLIDKLNNQIKRESRNAVFDYQKDDNDNYIINEFIPHQDGLEINKEELTRKIEEFIISIDDQKNIPEEITPANLDIPLQVVKPDITLEKTNDLGIKELIGFGDSEYDHSIPNRVWNVNLTAEKMNNILVAPGEEFRFNNALGEVSRRTGYRSAYVISGGKTVLGDGGGVCQVSTTYFRAILNAGLKVTKRKAHSYRVSYYELNQKPGIDATVYSGDVDLRFINDTENYILIRSSADSDELYMKVEIYGTSDGRTTEIVDHKTWDQRGAPASAYYPTTDLPAGVTKQIDWAVSGIKASFKNVIKDKEGNLIREEEYYSNYVPWSAKYLQGI